MTHVAMVMSSVNKTAKQRPGVRSVTLNLANKFSQCTFSVAEHYDLFSDLIIPRKRDGVDHMTSYRTDCTEPTEKLLQE